MRPTAFFAAIATSALAATMPAGAQSPEVSSVVNIVRPWIRFITPTTPAAGYFTVTNAGARPVVITGASSPDCGSLMLHQSSNMGGTEQMDMVTSVTVPAHGSVRFAPGGYHLMCTSPSAGVTPGHSIAVTLNFADRQSITQQFMVHGVSGR